MTERKQPDEGRREDDPVSLRTTSVTATDPTTGTKPQPSPERTPEEQEILDLQLRAGYDPAWVERHAELILEQARFIGNL
jgi:hypothetical protein